MAKVHMQSNKAVIRAPIALCASQMTGAGKVRFNSRRSYSTMGSPIIKASEFAATEAKARCAHCVDILRQRQSIFPKTFAAVFEEGA